MNSNNPIYDRSEPKPSTFTVPQPVQTMRDKAAKQQQPKPPVEADMFLNLARREGAKVDIGLVSGKEYLEATIKHVERYMLVIQHEGRGVGIMKTAIASVAR